MNDADPMHDADAIEDGRRPPGLVAAAAAGDEAATRAVVLSLYPLCYRLAGGLARRGHNVEDLAHVGVLAVYRAIELFRPERGRPFGIYARIAIRNAIRSEVRGGVGPVRRAGCGVGFVRDYERERQRLANAAGHRPGHDEVVSALGWGEARCRALRRAVACAGPAGPAALVAMAAPAAAEDGPVTYADAWRRFEGLPEARRRALAAYRGLPPYDRPHTLEEAGALSGVTRQRAHQLVRDALRELRRAFRVPEEPPAKPKAADARRRARRRRTSDPRAASG